MGEARMRHALCSPHPELKEIGMNLIAISLYCNNKRRILFRSRHNKASAFRTSMVQITAREVALYQFSR
jgi:hypothetical protein